MKENLFRKDNSFSADVSITDTFMENYIKTFQKKGFNVIKGVEEKTIFFQRKGIDRRLFIKKKGDQTKIVTVEEIYKKTFDTDFSFSLEWLEKNLDSNFIAFLYENKQFFFFNRDVFETTISKNKKEWFELAATKAKGFYFKTEVTSNTKSIVIPHKTFISAYKDNYTKATF